MISVASWLVRILAGVIGFIVIVVAMLYLVSGARLGKHWGISPEAVVIPTDSASIAYGQHVAAIRGCTGCHLANLAGGAFIDAPEFARLWARNLTPGKGGAGATYADADWVRSIRHGDTFSGGKIPGGPPNMPPARNLTPDVATGIGTWSLEEFRTVLREGRLPNGTQLDTLAMPVRLTRHLTELETAALFTYFKSVPAKPYGNR